MAFRVAALVTACVVVPPVAVAQSCTGLAGFDTRRWQLSLGGGYNREATSLGAGVSLGGNRFFYGGLGVSTSWLAGRDASAQSIAAAGGYQFVLGRGAILQWCPYGSMEFTTGPRGVAAFGTVVDVTETSSVWGVAVGVTAQRTRRLHVIPTSSFSFVHAAIRARDGGTLVSEHTVSFMALGVGVGFVLRDAVTVRPAVSFPLDLEGAPATMHLRVTYHFGLRE